MKTALLLLGLFLLSVIVMGKTYTLKIDGGGTKGYYKVEYKDDSTRTSITCMGDGPNARPKVITNDGKNAASASFVNNEFEVALGKIKQGQLNNSYTATDASSKKTYVVSWKGKDVSHVTITIAPEVTKK